MATDLGLEPLSGSASALNADAIAAINISGYKTASIQVTGTFSGTLSFQASNDNATFFPVYAEPIGGATPTPVTATTVTGIFHLPLNFSYLRIRMTAFVSGTATVNAELYLEPISEPVGPVFTPLMDGAGTALTSQANGGQRALDIGIDVAGVQIDPRLVGFTRLTLPADLTASTQQSPSLDNKGKIYEASEHVAYAKWGQAFGLTTGEITIAVTTEFPFLLIKNPVASGKIIRIKKFALLTYSAGAPNSTIFRIYFNPTVTANGTALTAVGNRQVGQAAAVSTSFKSPTTTANGSLYGTHKIVTTEFAVDYDLALIIDPGNSLLVTAQVNTSNNPSDISVEFIEE